MMLLDVDAERAAIGSLLLDRDAIIAVQPILGLDDLTDERCRLVYAAILACVAQRQPADLVTLAARLRARGELDALGGVPALLDLSNAVPTAAHADYYAQIVADLAARRRLLQASAAIARAAANTDVSLPDTVAACMQQLAAASASRITTGAQVLADVIDTAVAQQRDQEEIGIATGLHDLDHLLGRLLPGDLCIVAGRPGHGKTSLAMTLARNLARQGASSYIVSLEMSRQQLLQRLVALQTGIGIATQRSQRASDTELAEVFQTYGQISAWPIWIDDPAGLTIDDLRLRVLRHAQQHGPPALLIVDYLQRMRIPVARGSNYAQAVGQVSSGLKTLARELGAPVVVLSQLNRELDRRTVRVPQLSDLRESGDIEADADQVLFVVRPDLFDPQAAPGAMDLYLAKNRHGGTGLVRCAYDAPRTEVRSLARHQEAA